MVAWTIFCILVALSFIVPGGALTVLFFALIGTPIWLLLFVLVAYIKAWSKIH